MSATPIFPEPAWLKHVPAEGRRKARLGWLLDLCALYGASDGKMTTFSVNCGFSASAVGKAKHLGQISPEMVVEIEKCLGRDVMPREVLLPELFQVEA